MGGTFHVGGREARHGSGCWGRIGEEGFRDNRFPFLLQGLKFRFVSFEFCVRLKVRGKKESRERVEERTFSKIQTFAFLLGDKAE